MPVLPKLWHHFAERVLRGRSARRRTRDLGMVPAVEALEGRTLLAGLVMSQSVFDPELFGDNLDEQIPVDLIGTTGVVGYSYAIIDGDPQDPIEGAGGNAVMPADGAFGVFPVPSSASRPQEIASIAKAVTGSTMLHLMQEQTNNVDQLENILDDPVVNYLPGTWGPGSGAGWSTNFNTITIQELMNHSSGLLGATTTSGTPTAPGGFFTGGGNVYNYSGLRQVAEGGFVNVSKPTEYWTNNFAWFRVVLPYMWDEIDNGVLNSNSVSNVVDMSQLVPEAGLRSALTAEIEQEWGVTPVSPFPNTPFNDWYVITPDRLTASIYKYYVSEFLLEPAGISDPETQTTGVFPTLLYQIGAPAGVAGIDTDNASAGTTPGGQLLNAGPRGWNLSAIDVAQFLSGIRHGAVDGSTILEADTIDLMDDQYLGWRGPATTGATFGGDFGEYFGHDGVNFRAGAINQNSNNTQSMVFPNDVEAAFLINSQIQTTANANPRVIGGAFNVGGAGTNTVTTMANAYDNAWTELVYDGNSLLDVATNPAVITADDTFTIRANTNPAYIDIMHAGSLGTTITRRIDTLQKLTINGLGGNDTFIIQTLPANLELVINGGDGINIVTVGGPGPVNGFFDLGVNAPGHLTFNGGKGFDQLTIDDTNVTAGGHIYTVRDDEVFRTAAGTYEYDNVNILILNTSNQADFVNVESSSATTFTNINTQGGADTITVGGEEIDNIHGTVNLVGGNGDDLVRFWDVVSYTEDSYQFDVNGLTIKRAAYITYGKDDDIELFAGNAADTVTVDSLATGQTLDLTTASGDDEITINLSSASFPFSTVLGDVEVHGGVGSDTLNVRDVHRLFATEYTVTEDTVSEASSPVIEFDGIDQVNVVGAFVPVDPVSGLNKGNTYDIERTAVPTKVRGSLFGDVFHVGTSVFGDQDLDGIDGLLTIDGLNKFGGEDVVHLRDQLGFNSNYTIQDDHVAGTNFAGVDLVGIEHVILNASNVGHTILVENAPSDTRYTINGGFGNNSYLLAFGSRTLATFDSPLTINGGVNDDVLYLFDQYAVFSPPYVVTDNSIERDGFGEPNLFGPGNVGVTFSAITDIALVMNDSSNTISVESTIANLTLISAGGDDEFQIGTGVLEDLSGLVTIDAGTGTDVIFLHDEVDTGNDTYAIDETSVSKPGFSLVYNNAEALTLNANLDNNTINVEGVLETTPLWINAGAGGDTIRLAPTTQNLSVIQGEVFVDGQGGMDTVVLHDEAANPLVSRSFTITDNLVTRPSLLPLFPGFDLHYEEAEQLLLHLGAANDGVDIQSTAPGMHVVVEAGGGDDFITANVPTAAQLTLDGGAGVDTVELLGTAAPEEISVSAGHGSADVNLISIEDAQLDLAGGSDVLVFQGITGVDEDVEVIASTNTNEGTLRVVGELDLVFQNTEILDLLANPGDADTATFVGTDQPDVFEVDLAAEGTNLDPVLEFFAQGGIAPLLTLRDYRNFGTLGIKGGNGADVFNVYVAPAGPGNGRNLFIDGEDDPPGNGAGKRDELNVFFDFPPKPNIDHDKDKQNSSGTLDIDYGGLEQFFIEYANIEKAVAKSSAAKN